MLIIGHDGDRLEVYNPWGITSWITVDQFVNGHVGNMPGPDGKPQNVPQNVDGVLLPGRHEQPRRHGGRFDDSTDDETSSTTTLSAPCRRHCGCSAAHLRGCRALGSLSARALAERNNRDRITRTHAMPPRSRCPRANAHTQFRTTHRSERRPPPRRRRPQPLVQLGGKYAGKTVSTRVTWNFVCNASTFRGPVARRENNSTGKLRPPTPWDGERIPQCRDWATEQPSL